MRVSIIVAALAVVASALSLGKRHDQAPQCVKACISKYEDNTDSCKHGDMACYCKNQAIVEGVGQCLHTTCPKDDLEAALKAACAECAKVGVTPTQCSSTPA